jgi:cytochrome P450
MTEVSRSDDTPALFQLFAPLAQSDPYPFYRMLLDQGPVTPTPIGALVIGYDEASRVLKDPTTFSSELRKYLSPLLSEAMGGRSTLMEGRSMLFADPPDHERLRGVVARAFTPKSIAALEPLAREISEHLLAPMRDDEPFDVVDAVAYPLPVLLIAKLLGVPAEDRPRFKRWSDDLVAFNDLVAAPETLSRAEQSITELRDYFMEQIERRRHEPSDDLVGRLVAANEGGILSAEELVSQCVLLLVAGNETTTHLIGNAVNTLARFPEQRDRLVVDPALIGNAVEEVLRFDGVVHATIRIATRDTTVGIHDITAGTAVLVILAGAHRDGHVFEEPDAFDVGRANAAKSLGFGGGIHYCLGASLARLETRVALETLLRKAPHYRIARPEEELTYTSFFLRGPERLDVVAA